LSELVARIGENMNIRRSGGLSVSPGVVATYIHNAVAPDLGKIGVLVALESAADAGKLMALGKQLAMHVAAASPLALRVDQLPADVVAREREIFADQARQSGKPENVVEKMIEGRMRKFYEEKVLLSQTFVIDDETPIAKVLEKASKDFGTKVELAGYLRFAVGEGIDKPTTDFAAEVKATAGH
jgi:elongation factor Ts